MTLRKTPRAASWNKTTDTAQVALRDFVADTRELVAPLIPPRGAWSVWLDVGVPADRGLDESADLDNYLLPLVRSLSDDRLVSAWCSKWHSTASHVMVAPARAARPQPKTVSVRTTASAENVAYKQQVRAAVAHADELAPGPVRLQIAFTVGPTRSWLNLWKPTIDALDPILGRTQEHRDWHPKDGRIVDLGLHLRTDPMLGNDVELTIAARTA